MRAVLALLVLGLFVGQAVSEKPGIRASISQKGINYVKSVAVPMLVRKLQGTRIPDVSFSKDGVTGSIHNIVIRSFGIGQAGLNVNPGHGVTGSLGDLSASIHADWNYKLKIWPHPGGSGSVDASMSGASANLGLDVTASGGRPHVNTNGVSFNVGSLSLSFHGGLTALVLNIIKGLFMGSIKNEISKSVTSAVTAMVNNDANAALATLKLDIPLPFHAPYDIAATRFDLTNSPIFDASGFIGVDLLGDIVNKASPQRAPFTPPALPAWSSSAAGHYVQLVMSPYVLESAAWVYEQAGLLRRVVLPSEIPASSPLQLNTLALAFMSPGMALQYPNMNVQLALSTIAGQHVTATATTGGVRVAVPLSFAFQPQTASGTPTAFTLGCTMSAALSLSVRAAGESAQVLRGNLTYLQCPLQLIDSSVGQVDFSLLKGFFDFMLPNVVLPSVNILLNLGLPLPSMDGFALKDTVLQFGDGYFLVASNFAFNGTFFAREDASPGVAELPVEEAGEVTVVSISAEEMRAFEAREQLAALLGATAPESVGSVESAESVESPSAKPLLGASPALRGSD